MMHDTKDNQGRSIVESLLNSFKHNEKSYPHILLGQFERVGSTFLLDNYEASQIVYNEPYKQLVPTTWPIARGYHGALLNTSDDFFASHDMQPLNKLWMYNFVISKYVPASQVIKETNLYFALPIFLSFFPYRSIEILSRHPLGILSSFARNNLFYTWKYQHVMAALQSQLLTMGAEKQTKYSAFFIEKADWKIQILRLIALNSLIIAETLGDEAPKITKYVDVIKLASPDSPLERDESSIFGTAFRKEYDDFDKRFNDETIHILAKEADACIRLVHKRTTGTSRELFDKLFTVYFEYPFLRRSIISPLTKTVTNKRLVPFEVHFITRQKLRLPEFIALSSDQDIYWSTHLVTNQEMGSFMQELLDNGLDPSLVHLFLRENMIPERGGRLQLHTNYKKILITKHYEKHPAYWISWLGAAAYALRIGAALPTSSAWQYVYSLHKWSSASDANHTYSHDDTVETGRLTKDNLPIDFFGNLKIWCSDWTDELFQNKAVAGISWKHNFSETYRTITEKPFLTNSRVIGARLVICSKCPPRPLLTAKEIVHLIEQAKNELGLIYPTVDDVAEANRKIGLLFDCSIHCKHTN